MRWFIRMFFRTVRSIVIPPMLLWDRLTTPKGIERSQEEQQMVDEQTARLALYQFVGCPFCVKTRRAIVRLSLNIELRDAQKNPQHRSELEAGGGEIKVPCLRIEDESGDVHWMYESSDIISYLQQKFGKPA